MTDLDEIQRRTFEASTEATRTSYPPERRLAGAALGRYLDRRAFVVVSTTRPDGRPHAALSSYVRRGSAFWLPTVAGSVRARNVRHQPWASLVVTEGDHGEHVVVMVEGPARTVAPADVPPDVADTAGGQAWVSLWLRVDAERLLSYAAEGAAQ